MDTFYNETLRKLEIAINELENTFRPYNALRNVLKQERYFTVIVMFLFVKRLLSGVALTMFITISLKTQSITQTIRGKIVDQELNIDFSFF